MPVAPGYFGVDDFVFPWIVSPAVTDVRNGTTYGPGNELTGTLVSPPAPTIRPSISATIGDAVVDWLNYSGRNWTTSGWTATRSWAPDITLPDLKSQTATLPLVEVVPDSSDPEEGDTRVSEEFTVNVFIVVRAKYQSTGAVPNSWVDPFATLAEQIADQLRNEEFVIEKKVVCEITKLDPLIDPTELRDRRTAVSVIEATFRVYRVS